ncbi:MAG: ABC transporter substrate-binding protein [Clostridia bacterium]|nr:ABC transporter substrate-binding protein [Clostridia bacterium]
MKKLLALLMAVAMLLTMCVGLAEEHEPVTLQVWIVQTDWSDAWDNEMEPKFEAEYPWIDVEAVGVGSANADFIAAAIAAEDTPAVWQCDNNDTYFNAISAGLLADLSEMEVAQSIPQAYRDAFTHDGVLFGLTQGAAFSVLYINMAILEEAGWTEAPANWDEFIQCCADIAEKTDAAPLTLAGDKTTTCWMLYELIIANTVGDELGLGVFEEQFKAGTFDFAANPEIAAKLEQVVPYIMTGTSTMTEDDVTAAMTDGIAAMCIAGNWTANNICSGIEECTGDASKVKAVLAPFNPADKGVWISVSPETAFGLSAVEVSDAEKEAREIFFNWVFQPENFAIIQNARGTVPVLSTMTDDQIKVPAAIAEIVPAMNAANFVYMGFNCWTSEFKDGACTMLKDVYAGNMAVADAVTGMTELLQTYHR